MGATTVLIKRLSKESYVPDRVFFQPPQGWVGDVIPFSREGELMLFYLLELRETPKPGTPWALVSTRDLVTFEDRGIALPHGTRGDADFNAYTGSIVEDADGIHHLFYTAQNPDRVGPDGLPLQLVAHASSTDGMATWDKHPEHTFGAPSGYESADWRDPFVFQDPASGVWRMLLAARHEAGPDRRRGVIAQLTSRDLITWEPIEPFWDPRRYITHECPEVFSIGKWWYLVYSEFSESFTTRYRISRSPDGPWMVPDRDTIDGRAFYAAKSAELDGRRIFAGWIASREGDTDDGAWQWAGTMSLLEARAGWDGSLAFSVPEEIIAIFDDSVDVGIVATALDAPDGYSAVVGTEPLPAQCYVRAEIEFEAGTTECGLLLRSSQDGDQGYVVRLEPRRDRMVFDRWPRHRTGPAQWQVSGDVPHVVELERPADLTATSHVIEVVLDGDLAVIVLDREICLSTRLYDDSYDRLGIFVGEGAVKFQNLTVRRRSTT